MNEHHHIALIGASADGIEEIPSFFDQKPLDDSAPWPVIKEKRQSASFFPA